ncbi:zinc finger protein 862-like [Ptychodera flava]|uniref:zinc finger protein 862-like n=1 Tax=Ptychodera flava TaxID=63121 RepID=UPI003969FBD1
MYCKQCRSAYGQLAVNKVAIARTSTFYSYSKGPFVIGSENFRHSSLVAHAQSKGHSVAIEHVKHRTAPCGTSSAEMALQKMNESVFSKLTNLFRNAHSICVNSRPFKDYVWMSSLDVMKGVEVGETYRNDKACRQFITAISEVERERLQNETSDNKFISIVSDGSTDVSVIENEIVYIRSAREGNVKIYFCSLEEVKKADAAGIYNAITHSVSEAMGPESLGKVVGFAADGASVNTGKSNGVIVKLRENLSPSIVMIKCLVHRLELAFKEAVKCKAHDCLMTLLGELYKMYHKSPLQRTNLKRHLKLWAQLQLCHLGSEGRDGFPTP